MADSFWDQERFADQRAEREKHEAECAKINAQLEANAPAYFAAVREQMRAESERKHNAPKPPNFVTSWRDR